jgi:hypothetical protein
MTLARASIGNPRVLFVPRGFTPVRRGVVRWRLGSPTRAWVHPSPLSGTNTVSRLSHERVGSPILNRYGNLTYAALPRARGFTGPDAARRRPRGFTLLR